MSSNWMGIVCGGPNDWRRQKFGDVFRQRVERGRQELPLLSVTGESGVVLRDSLDRRDSSNADKSRYLAVMPGDVVYNTMRMWQGVSGISPHQGITSPAYTVCMLSRDIHSKFAGYLLKMPNLVTEFHSRSQGIVNDTLSLKYPKFAEIPVALPPLHEQRRIAEILSSVDEAIAATRAVIAQTRKVKQAVLERLLTKGIGHTRFKQTEIGEIPEGWSTARIDEIGEVIGGRQRSPAFTIGEERPYLRVANVFDNAIDTTDILRMKFSDVEFSRYRLELGDILLNEGQSIHLVGRNARYLGSPEDCCFQNTLIRFRASNCMDSDFAFALMQHLFMQGRFSEIATQTTSVAHLGASRFASLIVPVPPAHEQRKIGSIYNHLLATEDRERSHLSGLLTAKSALMSDLLTGRKRVTDALPLAAE